MATISPPRAKRVQPGVRRVLQSLRLEDTILDLGCGSGAFARALAASGHTGRYVGVDFSPTILERARSGHYDFPVTFLQADLASPEQLESIVHFIAEDDAAQPTEIPLKRWAVVTAFAVLHHLPGRSLRLDLLKRARRWLLPGGRLILSTWQFSSNKMARSRSLPWSTVGLSMDDVDGGDHLVDWRGGAPGVRYVHEFRESELAGLAAESGFSVTKRIPFGWRGSSIRAVPDLAARLKRRPAREFAMQLAITRQVSRSIERCELTYLAP